MIEPRRRCLKALVSVDSSGPHSSDMGLWRENGKSHFASLSIKEATSLSCAAHLETL